MSTTGEVVDLGTYKTGETPLDLAVRFDDNDGTQLDISSGYTATGWWRERNGAPADATSLAVSIQTGANPLGLAVVNMTAAMVATAGVFQMEVWVGTSGNAIALASQTFTYRVEPSIGTTPTFP